VAHRNGATLKRVMAAHPEHWEHHYHGDPLTLQRLMMHSYSDRIRYYWNFPEMLLRYPGL